MTVKIYEWTETPKQTTDNSTKTVWTYAIPSGSVVEFQDKIVALHSQTSSEGDFGANIILSTAVRRAAAGMDFVNSTATSTILDVRDMGLSTATLVYDISGTNVRMRLAGINTYTVDWLFYTRILVYTP